MKPAEETWRNRYGSSGCKRPHPRPLYANIGQQAALVGNKMKGFWTKLLQPGAFVCGVDCNRGVLLLQLSRLVPGWWPWNPTRIV